MKILVDADACPVKEIILNIAKSYHIQVMMFIDTSHILHDTYAEVITVDQARDSVDIALVNQVAKGDIVITQDFGLAAMVLSKGAYAINQNGMNYTNDNIDKLLFERHLSQKSRKAGLRGSRHKKRQEKDDDEFALALKRLVNTLLHDGESRTR